MTATAATFASHAPAAAEARRQSGNVAFEDIVVRLGSPASPRLILDRISLDIPAGQFVCVLGPSGCGKSTLLNVIAGLVAPASGSVSVDVAPVIAPGSDRGVVFQDPPLVPLKSVNETVRLGPLLAGAARLRRNASAGRRWRGSAYRRVATAFPSSCPAACSSASASRARSPTTRACC